MLNDEFPSKHLAESDVDIMPGVDDIKNDTKTYNNKKSRILFL